jgi:hypothetical protein
LSTEASGLLCLAVAGAVAVAVAVAAGERVSISTALALRINSSFVVTARDDARVRARRPPPLTEATTSQHTTNKTEAKIINQRQTRNRRKQEQLQINR